MPLPFPSCGAVQTASSIHKEEIPQRLRIFFFYETPEEISSNIKVLILIGGLWWLMIAKNIFFFFFCIHWNKDLWENTTAEFVNLGSVPTTALPGLGKGLSLGRKERGNKERGCDLFCLLTSFFSKASLAYTTPTYPSLWITLLFSSRHWICRISSWADVDNAAGSSWGLVEKISSQ